MVDVTAINSDTTNVLQLSDQQRPDAENAVNTMRQHAEHNSDWVRDILTPPPIIRDYLPEQVNQVNDMLARWAQRAYDNLVGFLEEIKDTLDKVLAKCEEIAEQVAKFITDWVLAPQKIVESWSNWNEVAQITHSAHGRMDLADVGNNVTWSGVGAKAYGDTVTRMDKGAQATTDLIEKFQTTLGDHLDSMLKFLLDLAKLMADVTKELSKAANSFVKAEDPLEWPSIAETLLNTIVEFLPKFVELENSVATFVKEDASKARGLIQSCTAVSALPGGRPEWPKVPSGMTDPAGPGHGDPWER